MQLKWPMLWDLFSLFPAHAGVILVVNGTSKAEIAFPRTRGGDPHTHVNNWRIIGFSPHTRG